jgi:hypothetical protein
MTNTEESTRRRRTASRLVFGGFLILIGALLFAVNLGVELPAGVWQWWPLLLVGLGSVKLVLGGPDEREGGFWILLAGVYSGISVFHLAGLSWATAWPVFLIGAGLWTAWCAASGAGRGKRASAEDRREA